MFSVLINSLFCLSCGINICLLGNMVFYPIVFSLYNPAIIYEGKQIPMLHHLEIHKNTNGFWRDFGFGMACMYKNDYHFIGEWVQLQTSVNVFHGYMGLKFIFRLYLNYVGGFDLSIQGWGSEDVVLYRKFARSSHFSVVRTPVAGLYHHWHEKKCHKTLNKGKVFGIIVIKNIQINNFRSI